MKILTEHPEQFDLLSKDFIESADKENPQPSMVTPNAAVMDKVPAEHRGKFPAALKDKIIRESKYINVMLKNNTLTGIDQITAERISSYFKVYMEKETVRIIPAIKKMIDEQKKEKNPGGQKTKSRTPV